MNSSPLRSYCLGGDVLIIVAVFLVILRDLEGIPSTNSPDNPSESTVALRYKSSRILLSKLSLPSNSMKTISFGSVTTASIDADLSWLAWCNRPSELWNEQDPLGSENATADTMTKPALA